MTRNKKALWTLLPVVMLMTLALLLSACGGQSAGNEDAGAEQAKEAAAPAPGDAGFQEFPMGDPHEVEGMDVGAVYFQAVDMEPRDKAGLSADEADIHIEADIHTLKNNKTGFGAGEWMPNLTIAYKIEDEAAGETQEGILMQMNASDGPHYGRNLKMGKAGKYKLTFTIDSPEKKDHLLHVDKETGVPGRFWKKPVVVSWDFDYVPVKK